jgi:hypothetical protein
MTIPLFEGLEGPFEEGFPEKRYEGDTAETLFSPGSVL